MIRMIIDFSIRQNLYSLIFYRGHDGLQIDAGENLT
jgi:hypothetical protein